MPFIKPVVILSHYRCGTNLLRRTLQTHPNLWNIGEPFNEDHLNLHKKFPNTLEMIKWGIKKGGFVIHHHQTPQHDGFWNAIESTNVKIIRLLRRDQFKQYVSYQLSKKTYVFHLRNNQNYTPTQTIKINTKKMVKWFEELDYFNAISAHLKNPKITIHYEDLCESFDEQMYLIQEFLKVRKLKLSPATKKIETRPIKEVVENYEEVIQKMPIFRKSIE